jgi:urea transport system permease protein
MGVINMAHGEFIMMGAYTGYVVQLFVPDYTLSILVALPLAFAVTFGGVWRWSGWSSAGSITGRWKRCWPPSASPSRFSSWPRTSSARRPAVDRAGLAERRVVLNDVVSISYIRIAIFVLALFPGALLFVNRTRLGLEVRAVTQNPAWPRPWASTPTASTC